MKFTNCISKGNSKSVYIEDNKAYKVFERDYNKSNVLYEALNTSRVEDTGLVIPKILSLFVDDGKWVIESEYVEGSTLEELIQSEPQNAEKYIEKMVDYQLEIHSHSNPLLIKLKDKLVRQINSLSAVDATGKYELLTRLDSMPKHTKLCHGDFCPSNIIMNSSGKMIAVDWVHATQGNASADAARTYLLFALTNQDYADIYLNIFCKKSDTAKQYVQQWIPIVAAAQMEKNRSEEAELLQKWISIIEYQ